MPIVVFQMKEAEAQHVDTSVPNLQSSDLLGVVIIEEDGTKVHKDQEASPIPIPPQQGEVQKEDVKTKELDLTTRLEE